VVPITSPARMTEQYYSAEEAAQILGLQVRTVRNYVRDGRLPGARIGKQYRITRVGLEAFVGGGSAPSEQQPSVVSTRAVEVSSVIQVDSVSAGEADRVTNTLAALTAGAAGAAGAADRAASLRVEPIYDEQRARLKVIVVGDVGATIEVIRTVDAIMR
jgi:excisionase family DNA binding protein